MADVVTLTMNPSIDLSISVERVTPFHKLRASEARRDPGGGGINVARVVKRLGADVVAMYPRGGQLGELLRRLLEQEGVTGLSIPIAGETREDFTVFERSTGSQYRFLLPGPQLTDDEWNTCLTTIQGFDRGARYVVVSGSLPPGVPDDFYARVARMIKPTGSKIVVDTSGPPLRAALEAGVHLVKPSLNEFRILMGAALETQDDWIKACRSLVDGGKAEMVALTLGEQGALLVVHDRVLHARALPINPASVVGAGDSFLGGMIWSLTAGHPIETAFRYAVAAGSGALIMPGTELCQRADVERLFRDVDVRSL
jgi:6-phosphofructokinase 2